jgi:hypothetical protein
VVPKSFFEARFNARLRAFDAARDATLEGDDESGGAWGFGGGGNVVLALDETGDSALACSSAGDCGHLRSCSGNRRAARISTKKTINLQNPRHNPCRWIVEKSYRLQRD